MSAHEAAMPRARGLDGLRGLAVVAVLLFHSGLLAGGYLGVDVFFVLSGYLITTILLVEVAGTGSITLSAFWARRARRLLPALFLVVAAVAVYAVVYAEATELDRIRGDGFATLGYVANWRSVFADVNYWDLFRRPSPFEHTWSLAIEEQFYVVWPLLLMVVLAWARRRNDIGRFARRVFFVAGGLAAVAALWALWIGIVDQDPTRVYFGTDTRAPAILLGAGFAAWTQWRGPARAVWVRRSIEVVGLGGLLFLAAACTTIERSTLFRGGLLACSVAGLAVLIAAAHPRPGLVARMLSFGPLVGLGLVSYGLYLWHWPIFLVFDAARTGFEGWTLFFVRFAITLVVAVASYFLVEMPIRRGAGSPARLRLLTPVLMGSLVGVIFFTTAGGIELSTGKQVFPNPTRVRDRAEQRGATRVMVAGNSIGNVLGEEGIAKVTTEPPIVLLNDGVFSCDFPTVPLIRTEFLTDPIRPIRCDTPWTRAIRDFDPEIVLLISGDVHVTEYRFRDGWAAPCEPRFRRNYRRALDEAVRRLSARGAKVVVTTSAISRFFMPESFNRQIKQATECTNTLVRQYAAAHPGVGFADLHAFVCPEDTGCLLEMDGAEVRPDGVHYRGLGAQKVASWILGQVGIDARPAPP